MATNLQLTWTNVIGTLMAGSVIVGGALSGSWVLFQQQIAEINQKIERGRADDVDRATGIKHDVERIQKEADGRFHDIDAELLHRAELFLTMKQFLEFKDAYTHDRGVTNKRLDTIEQTRPTADTLGSMSKSTDAVINRLDERVRALETRGIK